MSAKQRTAYRRSAPEAPLGIPAPGPKVNNAPLGEVYGNRVCSGWVFDEGRYAIQTRDPNMAKQIKRRKGVVLFADALVGPWMQTLLVPCKSEVSGRRIVDELLQCEKPGSDSAITIHGRQRGDSKLPQNNSVAKTDEKPPATQTPLGLDWAWIEQRKPEAVGVEFCIAFKRFDGQWAMQVTDPRLFPYFRKRGTVRLSGYSAGGWGTLRQFMFPCKSKAWARKIVLTALSTLSEYESKKHLLKGAMPQ